MFSPKIQGYIDDGGKEAALKRLQSLQNHVESIKKQINPESVNAQKTTFAEMLKESRGGVSPFRAESTKKIESPTSIDSLLNSVNKTNATNPAEKISLDKNPSRVQLLNMISKICKKHNVDEKLVQAVIRQESGFNPKATSHCGAMGLMQLMPATAKGLGVKDAYNPVQNVEGGVKHLKGLLARYNGNVVLALAAYNAGGGNVDKYGGIPPFKETQNYVKSILANYLS